MNPSQFSRWVKSNIEDNVFAIENVDYVFFDMDVDKSQRGRGRPGKDYKLTPDFAKKLCMTSQTERGEQARNYFLEVERRLKAISSNTPAIPQSFSEALLLAYQQQAQIEEQKAQLAVTTPKAEYFDDLVERGLALNFRETAKELGVPERKFITKLIDRGILYRTSTKKIMPYANWVAKGYFEIKEFTGSSCGFTSNQTLITVEGRDYLRKRISLLFPELYE